MAATSRALARSVRHGGHFGAVGVVCFSRRREHKVPLRAAGSVRLCVSTFEYRRPSQDPSSVTLTAMIVAFLITIVGLVTVYQW